MNGKNKLITALAAAQSEFRGAKLDSSNPFYKSRYASHGAIMAAVQPALTKHGLAIVQQSCLVLESGTPIDCAMMRVTTVIAHGESGESFSTEYIHPAYKKDKRGITFDPHTVASASTYGRRVSLAALLNVSIGDDNDGNELVEQGGPASLSEPCFDFISQVQQCDNIDELLKLKPNFDGTKNEVMAMRQAFKARKKALGSAS